MASTKCKCEIWDLWEKARVLLNKCDGRITEEELASQLEIYELDKAGKPRIGRDGKRIGNRSQGQILKKQAWLPGFVREAFRDYLTNEYSNSPVRVSMVNQRIKLEMGYHPSLSDTARRERSPEGYGMGPKFQALWKQLHERR